MPLHALARPCTPLPALAHAAPRSPAPPPPRSAPSPGVCQPTPRGETEARGGGRGDTPPRGGAGAAAAGPPGRTKPPLSGRGRIFPPKTFFHDPIGCGASPPPPASFLPPPPSSSSSLPASGCGALGKLRHGGGGGGRGAHACAGGVGHACLCVQGASPGGGGHRRARGYTLARVASHAPARAAARLRTAVRARARRCTRGHARPLRHTRAHTRTRAHTPGRCLARLRACAHTCTGWHPRSHAHA